MRIITPKTDNVGDTLSAQIFNVNFITELNSFITASGFSLDPELGTDTDTAMIQRAAAMYACTPGMYQDESSIANNFVINRVGNLAALGDFYKEGQFLFFKAAFTNTSTCTLKVNPVLLPIPLTFPDGTDLTPFSILQGRFSLVRYNETDLRWELISSSTPTFLQSYIKGMILSNDPSDLQHNINFSVGQARASNAPINLHLNTALTKNINATWVAGDGGGGLFNGTVAATTWYHAFIILNDTTGVLDAGFDLAGSGAAPLNLPAGWNVYRRVGSFQTDTSANIKQFIPQELAGGAVKTIFKTRGADFSGLAGLGRLSWVMDVPPDISPLIKCTVGLKNSTTTYLLVTNTAEVDQAPASNLYNLAVTTANQSSQISLEMLADTLSQISFRSSDSNATLILITEAYTDHRND